MLSDIENVDIVLGNPTFINLDRGIEKSISGSIGPSGNQSNRIQIESVDSVMSDAVVFKGLKSVNRL